MKTRCPHCRTKFNTPDEHEGKKIKCTKCGQPFVIAPFAEGPAVEVCTSCGRQIGELEQACVWHGVIVCKQCDQKLRKSAEISRTRMAKEEGRAVEEQVDVTLHIPERGEGIQWLPFRKASKVTFILALTLIFLAIFLFFQDRSYLRIYGSRFEIVTTTGPQSIEDWLTMFAYVGPSLFLMVRSFRPGLSFWRGLLTWLGGCLVSAGVWTFLIVLITGIRKTWSTPIGFPSWVAVMTAVTLFLMFMPGVILLRCGFRPKKGFA